MTLTLEKAPFEIMKRKKKKSILSERAAEGSRNRLTILKELLLKVRTKPTISRKVDGSQTLVLMKPALSGILSKKDKVSNVSKLTCRGTLLVHPLVPVSTLCKQ